MGYNTKIDWCDTSWNPVTGCYHDCEYCYARGIAKRFGGYSRKESHANHVSDDGTYELNEPLMKTDSTGRVRIAPYPFNFAPTLHRYRLDQPKKWSEPRTIFVCSMADLFGEWVPDEWIKQVFEVCEGAPQHRYLFLTKNPSRYKGIGKLIPESIIPPYHDQLWFGSSYTHDGMELPKLPMAKTFVSIEPLLAPITYENRLDIAYSSDWVIIGAETGNRKDKVIPEKKWIDDIATICKDAGRPVFMKESLRKIVGDDFWQEFPWGGETNER